MAKKHKYLSNLPHGANNLAVPISGLIIEILDRKKMLQSVKIPTYTSQFQIKEKHKNAGSRISSCTGYISTIAYRLLHDSKEDLFMDKNLDWESFIIFSKVLLDSFSILVPLLYGKNPKYKRNSDEKEYEVRSFNNLGEWFLYHEINDNFSEEYKKATKNWYKKLDDARIDHAHKFKTQEIIYKDALSKDTVDFKENQLISLDGDNFSMAGIESELKYYLRGMFDFLTFATHFLAEELSKSNVFITEQFRFKVSLFGDNRIHFNKLLFD